MLRQYGRELSVQDLDDLANTAKNLFGNPRRDSLPTSPVAVHSQRCDADVNDTHGVDENKGLNGDSSSGDDADASAASLTPPPMATPICTKEQFTLMMLLKLGKVSKIMLAG